MTYPVPYLGGMVQPTTVWTWGRPPPAWRWRWVWNGWYWQAQWFRIPLRPHYAYTNIAALTNMDPAGQPRSVRSPYRNERAIEMLPV